MTLRPGIEQTINGQRLYISDTGRQYDANLWDKINLPSHNIKMRKNQKFKGENSCKKHLWVKGIKCY